MTCPKCKGRGERKSIICLNPSGARQVIAHCGFCEGAGEVCEEKAKAIDIGRQIMAHRLKDGETIRQRATKLGVTPTDLSAVEQGDINTYERKELFGKLISETVINALAAAIMEEF